MPDITALHTPGLGDWTYLVAHDGVGVLVDPQRDVDRFVDAAEAAGVELRWVVETHVHNDYVSGARAAAERTGAELVLPAAAGAAYPHTLAFHREDLVHGDLVLRPLHTPGHTPEHTSYLLIAGGEEVAVFTGGSLLRSDAGRTDLLGGDRAAQLAAAQYQSVTRLAALPGGVRVCPTHGEGSFCTASSGDGGTAETTIADERATNSALAHAGVEEFRREQLAGLQPYPAYYARMGQINLGGPPPMPRARPPVRQAAEVARADPRPVVVDARPRAAAAAGLVPGSLTVELSEQFGVWVGWLVPFGTPLALVVSPDQDADDAVVQLARIGWDRVEAVVHDPAGWPEPLDSFPLVDVPGAVRLLRERAGLLDVRAPGEWADGQVDGAVHRYLPDLVDGAPGELEADRPVVVACASGYRSVMAASLLLRHGLAPVVLDDAGMPELAEAAGAAS